MRIEPQTQTIKGHQNGKQPKSQSSSRAADANTMPLHGKLLVTTTAATVRLLQDKVKGTDDQLQHQRVRGPANSGEHLDSSHTTTIYII